MVGSVTGVANIDAAAMTIIVGAGDAVGNLAMFDDRVRGRSQQDAFSVVVVGRLVGGVAVGEGKSSDDRGVCDCFIRSNIVTENSVGICLDLSDGNKITDNIVSNNTYGIQLLSSDYNTLARNQIFGHTLVGIKLEAANPKETVCVGNTIYDNEIYNNKINAEDSGNNDWNVSRTSGPNIIGGPYVGGNSWDDYPYSDTDGDGFGATYYPIPSGNNVDHLPLVEPILPDLIVSDIRLENSQIAYTLKNTGTYEAATGHVSGWKSTESISRKKMSPQRFRLPGKRISFSMSPTGTARLRIM